MPKIKSVKYLGEQDTYDLEVNTDDHQFFLANNVLTSNSHSISYSHISYYTAWLRNHYPTEFMCALLNSEDPNSDKAQEYINDCKKMGIQILPPQINSSSDIYKVIGDSKIATGLSAIKGCGTKALDNILDNQPFNSIQDFLYRTKGRVVNKTVIQSLAKAGAFSELGVSGKDIHDNYAKYRTKVNNAAKKHIEAHKNNENTSYVDYEFNPYDVDLKLTNKEWDKNTILLNEKEVLGRTISGSLHEVFSTFFSKGSSIVTPLNRVPDIRVGQKIKVEAIVSSKIKEFKIKNGPNVGKKFAKYLIEDVQGNTIGMTVWNHDYEKLRHMLVDGIPFKAVCKVSSYMGQKDLSLAYMERIYGQA